MTGWPSIVYGVIWSLLALAGCSTPCRPRLDYIGDYRQLPTAYQFQPGIVCVY